jgi:hypothetical protein
MQKAPADRFKRMHNRDGWQYFGDVRNQPARVYTVKNLKVTKAERVVLEKYLADTRLHRQLLGRVDSGLPLVDQLAVAELNVQLILDSGFWLQEIDDG